VERSLGSVRLKVWAKLSRFQRLVQPGIVVAKEVHKRRFAHLQRGPNCLGCGGFADQASLFFNPLIKYTGGDPGTH
jgi:hypothetical protein